MIFDDSNALITISGELRNVGEIRNANMGTTLLFGYACADLMGRNINELMPTPFSTHHHSFLMRYLETGKATLLGSLRFIFGQHRAGHLLPVEIYIREVASSQGNTFLGVLRQPDLRAQATFLPLALAQQAAPSELGIPDGLSSDLLVVHRKRVEASILALCNVQQIASMQFVFANEKNCMFACTVHLLLNVIRPERQV
jgi:PAS domain S-box-containing protein